ncbi:MAG: metallophosphoesterase family protein [Flavobacteriales bacterium AspAUS03]
MKRILLLSDTHSHIDDRILYYTQDADEVWHAGDIGSLEVTESFTVPVKAVYGNIDGQEIREVFPLHQRFFCEGVDVWITHIGGYPGRYDLRVREELKADPPKLFICGHSHILKVMFDRNLALLHMNPGAVGRYGFQKVWTMLRFCIHFDKIRDLELVELGK